MDVIDGKIEPGPLVRAAISRNLLAVPSWTCQRAALILRGVIRGPVNRDGRRNAGRSLGGAIRQPRSVRP